MTPDPLVAPAVVQPVIHNSPDGGTRPAPTVQEEQVADSVFGPEASRLAAAVLTAQTGLALMNHIALEVAPAKEEETEQTPRKEEQPEAGA